MCGRFNMIDDPLTRLLMSITGMDTDWQLETRFNIAPTETIPVLLQADDNWALNPMRWWLVPGWAPEPSTKYSMFNARSETLATSRAFREPFSRRRCIIPASGYYEWQKAGNTKVPFYIEPADDPGFAFAGLWDRWQRGDQVIESCTIVTAAAPESLAHIHHRIPVHLTTDEAVTWTSADTTNETATELLVPSIRTRIRVTPVSTVVNNARNKDERCIEPLGDSQLIETDRH
ncbi:MAG: SOS response-associated peptidase [Proteobacteria bacterium]|nr:SOS response-associated peptidase [Pseudomonadota bacterium]